MIGESPSRPSEGGYLGSGIMSAEMALEMLDAVQKAYPKAS